MREGWRRDWEPPIVVGGKGELLRVEWVEGRDGVGVLEEMGNEGRRKGGVMEGWG